MSFFDWNRGTRRLPPVARFQGLDNFFWISAAVHRRAFPTLHVWIAVPNDRTLWPGQAAPRQDPRPLDRMADVGGRTGDLIFPSADDFERHSAPLPLQELSGLILVVVCLLDDPECHAAPVG